MWKGHWWPRESVHHADRRSPSETAISLARAEPVVQQAPDPAKATRKGKTSKHTATANLGFEAKLCLRPTSCATTWTAAENTAKRVLGLIFLKIHLRRQLPREHSRQAASARRWPTSEGANPARPDEYKAEKRVPGSGPEARW